ncbi:argonaute [Thalictrum thalictroides]|uniref:Argonaute n=1 Tax=Thalictrum thalictroides TaxID=46969 RepID=A0A7J6VH58_THATH|nr:argonaute [Thalictrum thalictroides]
MEKLRPPPAPNLHLYAKPDRFTGTGRSGRHINMVSNHFKVSVSVLNSVFFQVLIKSEDNQAVEEKGIERKVMDKMYQTYSFKLAGKNFVDGEKALYTRGVIPQNKIEFSVKFEEAPVTRRGSLGPIALALKRFKVANTGDALRAFDYILSKQAAKSGMVDVGGVIACHGFHSSFHTAQGACHGFHPSFCTTQGAFHGFHSCFRTTQGAICGFRSSFRTTQGACHGFNSNFYTTRDASHGLRSSFRTTQGAYQGVHISFRTTQGAFHGFYSSFGTKCRFGVSDHGGFGITNEMVRGEGLLLEYKT